MAQVDFFNENFKNEINNVGPIMNSSINGIYDESETMKMNTLLLLHRHNIELFACWLIFMLLL